MQKIIISSKNPVKIQSALLAFQEMFPEQEFETEGIAVPSGVSDQPMSDEETLRGALTRIENASRERPGADFWVGMEGGNEDKEGKMEGFAWMVVKGKDGTIGKGRCATYVLPEAIATLVRGGMELGDADNVVFGVENSKHGLGITGLLTHGVLNRTKYYVHGMFFALVPFKNKELYERKS